ncbi:AraD1 family protein [Puia sp.]|uniref:AraD1 family protein n=1 Tax=Puia sp. TaxID=2045100 RepID=UPI002F402408
MTKPIRLVQLTHPTGQRRVALVEEPQLRLLDGPSSIYEAALQAVDKKIPLHQLITTLASQSLLDYDSIYGGQNEWQLLPSFDHPENPAACLVSGTGLTHKNSALGRQMMHQTQDSLTSPPTDSLRIYQWGVEGGSPKPGTVGVQPEWFYKGTGHALRAHNQQLEIPPFGDDGGEEPEVAGVYIVDPSGHPWRVGLTTANEFSDHVMEKKNYLYLAPSKLRNCAIGPELVIGGAFTTIDGKVSIRRNGQSAWTTPVHTGAQHMAHSLENLEHHHFKYPDHRVPGQAHIHFFGADAFSFSKGFVLQDGDVMEIEWAGMGRPLHNPLKKGQPVKSLVKPGIL